MSRTFYGILQFCCGLFLCFFAVNIVAVEYGLLFFVFDIFCQGCCLKEYDDDSYSSLTPRDIFFPPVVEKVHFESLETEGIREKKTLEKKTHVLV